MMRHALLASDLERRRIAQDLHDGVIQDLAGLGYVLPTAQRELHEGGNLAVARTTLDRATGMLQQDVVRLRSLLTDLYPPDLQGQGLVTAVGDLVQTITSDAGLDATVRIDPSSTCRSTPGGWPTGWSAKACATSSSTPTRAASWSR